MARAITEAELLKLRKNGQKSMVFAAIHVPRTVYTAQVNMALLSVSNFQDPVVEVPYDNGSGTLANVKPGMTMYVGSAAGLHDLGMVRIRKDPSATWFYIGETSEIPWADNLYLTVVEEYGLWTKHVAVKSDVAYMDYDVAYTDQHNTLDPVPVMGADVVLELTGASVTLARSWSSSWVIGSTISSYACTVTGPAGATVDSATSATPTFTFTAPGWYHLNLTVTAANGKTATGHRLVYVYSEASPPISDFEVMAPPSGSFDDGGWNFSIKMYGQADTVRERAKVILFAKDWYDRDEGSIGPVLGSENILASGWISREAITWNAENNFVEFEVNGPHYWLDQETSYPVRVEYTATAPTAWTSLVSLTVDRALWHVLHWRSTVTACLDITLTGDTNLWTKADTPMGTVLGQLKSIAEETIMATVLFNRYGQLYIEIDTQILPDASRTGIPVVMDLTQDDYQEDVYIERQTVNNSARLRASGSTFDGTNIAPISSSAPGGTIGSLGKQDSFDRLIVASQDALNILSGMLYARENNEYPAVDLSLGANNRMVDICPRQRVTMSLVAGDTVRGIAWTDKKFLPRQVEFSVSNDGYILVDVTLEAETSGPPGTSVTLFLDVPIENINDGSSIGEITFPLLPTGLTLFPDILTGGDEPPSTGCRGNLSAPGNGPITLWPDKFKLNAADADAMSAIIYYPCMIRAAAAQANTRVRIIGTLEKYVNGEWTFDNSAASWFTYGIDGDGNPIIGGINYPTTYYSDRDTKFMPAAQIDVAGFKISLPENGTPTPGAFNKTFDFSDGWQGWTYEGNTVPTDVRWNNGRLEKSRQRTYFKWYPQELYAVTGAVVQCDHGPSSYGPFAGFGVGIVNSESPLSVTWKWVNARLNANPTYTISSTDNGKRIHYVMLDEGEDNNDPGEFIWWMDNVQLTGFTSKLVNRRMNIQKIELYNVCGQA